VPYLQTSGTHISIISGDEVRKTKPDYFFVPPWHFLREFIEREKAFLSGEGRFVFPLPEIEIILPPRIL